ncbi:flagellar basal-body rod protein FlgG [Candidatus Methylospira mobilis]|uniref:Flagellar basal-body rod protein FlgG n=1 Tax=Candidatus Methylospira mobilis TaxID=1808979 RepID=A0A5Q0BJU9_9GAMM|nr:flagellar basal-body rod protein FlgG [Candidatus Methylospira mobilis]QFY42437.1 flagellar basal-body rod protein FlgG [Candidatus Methylospira mobilis]WNV04460.1 flagellar basal-body rod protein FlgG [Candidatus Methylospira mobilis]
MMRSLWISKTGMDVQQTQMDVTSNNLANASTTGFKKSRAIFQDLLYQTVRAPGAQSSQQSQLSSGLQLGSGSTIASTERVFTQGTLQQTGDQLSIAINGLGFFQVLMPDGSLAYTRDGTFQTDNTGQLVTSAGYVLQPPITIPPASTGITVGTDGTVTSTSMVNGINSSTTLGQITLNTFINPPGLSARGEGLYSQTQSSGPPTQGIAGLNNVGYIQQGYIETSNVNIVEEMVNLIQNQRAYEINSKSIQNADQMLSKLSQL